MKLYNSFQTQVIAKVSLAASVELMSRRGEWIRVLSPQLRHESSTCLMLTYRTLNVNMTVFRYNDSVTEEIAIVPYDGSISTSGDFFANPSWIQVRHTQFRIAHTVR